MVLASLLANGLQPFSMQPTFTTATFTQLQKSLRLKRGLENALTSVTFEYLVHKSVSRKVVSAKLSWIVIILTVSLLDIQPQIITYVYQCELRFGQALPPYRL
jgi:hypothetical protein